MIEQKLREEIHLALEWTLKGIELGEVLPNHLPRIKKELEDDILDIINTYFPKNETIKKVD